MIVSQITNTGLDDEICIVGQFIFRFRDQRK